MTTQTFAARIATIAAALTGFAVEVQYVVLDSVEITAAR